MIVVWFALLAAFASPSASPVPTRNVTLTPIETMSAYGAPCSAKPQAPFAHPSGTVFVGAITVANAPPATGTIVCSAYQGLARFDLDGLDAASIVKATLFYESKQGYEIDGAVMRKHSPCIGSVGVTNDAWMPEPRPISPIVPELETFKLSHGSFKSPPVDITAFVRAHVSEVKANGLVLDGAIDDPPARSCLAAVGHIELRLEITGAAL